MTIRDRKTNFVYLHCLNDVHPDQKPARLAALADQSIQAVIDTVNGKCSFPGADDCMNLETEIFRVLCEYNGVNIDAIYRSI